MAQLEISIAMATFNGAAFIEKQLISLAEQSYLPVELIVSDDGSTDDTLAIVERFRLKAPFRVSVLKNEQRLGYSRNFLRAVKACSADLIAFCDQDDIWTTTKLARCADAFQDPDTLLVHHNASVVTADQKYIAKLHDDSSAFQTTSPWDFSPGFTQVFRKTISDCFFNIQDKKALSAEIPHDMLFFFMAHDLGVVAYIAERLADYRQHGHNVFGWSRRITFKRRLRHVIEKRWGLYNYLSQQAKVREKLLRDLANEGVDWEGRALAGSRKWGRLRQMYEARAQVYGANSIVIRTRRWLHLLGQGGYSDRPDWTFGRSTSVVDLIIGVCIGPLASKCGLDISINDPACRKMSRS